MQVIEVDDVILHVLDSLNDISQNSSVIRDPDSQRIFNCSHGADGMNRCSDPSYPLRESPRFAGIAALKDELDASKHGAGGPSIGHLPPVYLDLYPQVSLDAGDWIDYHLCHLKSPPISVTIRKWSRVP
jgi:hypothetical protein